MRDVLAWVAAEWRGGEQTEGGEREAHECGLDRAPSLVRPVDVVEVEDERELVEGERGADAEEGGEQQHRVVTGAEGDDGRSRGEAGDDARHQVVQVDSAHRAAPPSVQAAQSGVGARSREREQEREQEKEERLAAWVVDVVPVARNEVEEVRHQRESTPRPRRLSDPRTPWSSSWSRVSLCVGTATAPALARALGVAKAPRCPQGEEGGERERGRGGGSDVGGRADEESAPDFENPGERLEDGCGVEPALEQRERHVDGCEEEGQEDGHLHHWPRLHRPQPHRHAGSPQQRGDGEKESQRVEPEEVDAAAADL